MESLTLMELAQRSRSYAARALSWTEISNLFARHVYFIRSGLERRDFETLWSAREDICYMVNGLGWTGRAQVFGCYVSAKEQVQREVLTVLSALTPGIVENSPENLGAGEYALHSLVNPYIQVAGDNGTAKGVWYSPGIVGHVEADGEYHAYATAIVFAADFIREESGWKLWHLRESDEMGFPLDGAAMDRSLEAAKHGQVQEARPYGMHLPSKAELEEMLAQGKIPGGRTGETLRTLSDLPPASPEHNLTMTDRPKTSLLHPNRFIDDMIEPYDTWDDRLSVLRDY